MNTPYKGAELISRHSDPAGGRHSIQIEINRALYLDEATRTKGKDFEAIQTVLDGFLDAWPASSARPCVRPSPKPAFERKGG